MDHEGRRITQATLAGRAWVADFIFTRCAGQCLMMSDRMAALGSRLPQEVQRVSFTVDPGWDTPEVLAAYAERYRAQDGRWIFVTGEKTALYQLCRDGFHLAVGEEGPPDEPITHSTRLVLVDPQGHLRGYYDAEDPAEADRLLRDVRALSATR